jgi:hypothetical protein
LEEFYKLRAKILIRRKSGDPNRTFVEGMVPGQDSAEAGDMDEGGGYEEGKRHGRNKGLR